MAALSIRALRQAAKAGDADALAKQLHKANGPLGPAGDDILRVAIDAGHAECVRLLAPLCDLRAFDQDGLTTVE